MKASEKKLWCFHCLDKAPIIIRKAQCLTPFRENPYDLLPKTLELDKRVVGSCNECARSLNQFRKANTIKLDLNNEYIIYRNI